MELIKHLYFRMPILLRLLLTVLITMIIFGLLIHLIEPEQFPSLFEGIWWAFVTGGTVGYGDYAPTTTVGRWLGIFLILTGAGLLTYFITVFAATTVKHEQQLSKGIVSYKGKRHVIFIGWNERTLNLMQLMTKNNPHVDMVLIDASLQELSYIDFPIHFIHGDATDDTILQKANVETATVVVATANMTKSEKEADRATILYTVAVRGNNAKIPIIVEILSTKQTDNAKRAGATTILRPNDFMSGLLYHELFRQNHETPFENILHLLYNQAFVHFPMPGKLSEESFMTICQHFLRQHILIIGYIENEKYYMNPPPSKKISDESTLIGMLSWKEKSDYFSSE